MKEQAERYSGAWRQGNAAARLLQSAATRTSALELNLPQNIVVAKNRVEPVMNLVMANSS